MDETDEILGEMLEAKKNMKKKRDFTKVTKEKKAKCREKLRRALFSKRFEEDEHTPLMGCR